MHIVINAYLIVTFCLWKIFDEAGIQIANSYGMFMISLLRAVIKHVNYNGSYKRLINQMANTGQRSAAAKLFGFNPCRVEYVLGTETNIFPFSYHVTLTRWRQRVAWVVSYLKSCIAVYNENNRFRSCLR